MKKIILFLSLLISSLQFSDAENLETIYLEPIYIYAYRVNFSPPTLNSNPLPPAFVGNRYLYTNSTDLNKALYEARRFAQTEKLQALMNQYQNNFQNSGASANLQRQQSFEWFKKAIEPYLNSSSAHSAGFNFVLPPTPYPKEGASPQELDQELKPLWDTEKTPLRLSGEVAKLQKKIGLYLSVGLSQFKSTATYLEAEMRRSFVDPQGLLEELPFSEKPHGNLLTPLYSKEGVEIREKLNETFVSEGVVGVRCANSPDLKNDCDSFHQWATELKTAYFLVDRLSYRGKSEAYQTLLAVLTPSSQFLVGYAEGLSSGAINFVKSLPDFVKNLPSLVPALYRAIVDYPTTWLKIQNFAHEKWEEILNSDSEKGGKIFGELAFDFLSLFFGPGSVEKIGQLSLQFTKGVGLAATRAALEVATETALKAGKFSQAIGQGLLAVTQEMPGLGRFLWPAAKESTFGRSLLEARGRGIISESGDVFKSFDLSKPIANPLPENRIFARAVAKNYAENIKSGRDLLSRSSNETFITAWDDVSDLHAEKLGQRLGLFEDSAGAVYKNTSEYTVLKFKFNGSVDIVFSPVDLPQGARGYGFLPGGRTIGGAREWLIPADAVKKGMIEFID